VTRPTLPLPLRNALAALALGALADDRDVHALAWLAATDPGPPSAAVRARLEALHLVEPAGQGLLAIHAAHGAAVRAHAARALEASAAYRALSPGTAGLARRLAQAAALWNAGLFFEVHEVLEAEWKTAAGAMRQALQGLIQLAVAFHHLVHGNRRGARKLLREGRARLAPHVAVLGALDVATLLADTAAWEAALLGRGPEPPAPPALRCTPASARPRDGA
jgi:hypothetical protein